MAKAVAILALLLVGCTNTTDAVLVDETCIQSHTQMQMVTMPMSCGKNCTTVRVQPVFFTVCDKSVTTHYPNPNYRGPK